MYSFREFVEAGGLMCYGPDLLEMFARLATMWTRFSREPGTSEERKAVIRSFLEGIITIEKATRQATLTLVPPAAFS
jgi:hypothetical protein